MEDPAPILLQASMPRSQAATMLAISAAILAALADLLIFHTVIRPPVLSDSTRYACYFLMCLMALATGLSIKSWLQPPVLVEASTKGLRDASKKSNPAIPWAAISSLSRERVILGDSRVDSIVVWMRNADAPPVYLPASVEPGGDVLLAELRKLHTAYGAR